MAAKSIFVVCASALLIQTIISCPINSINAGVIDINNVVGNGYGVATSGYGWGTGLNSVAGLGAANLDWAGNGLGGVAVGGWGLPSNGAAIGAIAAHNCGGEFPVTSISPFGPTGISIVSENTIQGPVTVVGQLPFLSAVALEGQLPSAGAVGVSYSCGDGSVGIVSEGLAAGAGLAGGYGYDAVLGLGNAGLLNAGWAGNGLGVAGVNTINAGWTGGCGCGLY